MTRVLKCSGILQKAGWQTPAYVALDASGCVTQISQTGVDLSGPVEEIPGWVIPGFQNAHSHAFQYAMTGLAEHLPKQATTDDFWTWRDSMYKLAAKVTPEHVESLATMLYAEMLRHGYTAVAEFHYLHRAPDGSAYADIAEVGRRLMAAAVATGIHLTLVPVLYQLGGFGRPASAAQKRFLSPTLVDYQQLLRATRAAAVGRPDLSVGQGWHSLRAVDAGALKNFFSTSGADTGPVHLHIAEQQREVDECLSHHGARPVAWLLEHCPVDARWNLVHATHMDGHETKALAKSGATVVICPTTEANLGDGIFPLGEYLKSGGRYAIGSDSQISLSPLEELRWLDYGQRLFHQRRNILATNAGDDSGEVGLRAAWLGGRAAMGLPGGEYFAVGAPFDGVVIDPTHPVLANKPERRRLAALIYAGDSSCFLGTMRRGKWLTRAGRHVNETKFRQRYLETLAQLL